MTDSTASAYLRTRVLTASPEQLRQKLLEGAVKYLRQAREGLEAKNFEASYDGFSKCRNIVIELMNSMRHEVAPDLCAKVHGLYVFIYQIIVEAGLEKDIGKTDRAIQMLEFERETWQLAIQQLLDERLAGNGETATDEAAPVAAPARTALSIQA